MTADPAYIRSLMLSQFRSYSDLYIEFDGRPVVLFGQNGAGKTNLLEAISLLSPGRGLRRVKLDQILRHQASSNPDTNPKTTSEVENSSIPSIWAVSASLQQDDDVQKIGTGQVATSPSRRHIRIDGQTKSGTDLAKCLTINWLTPAQDRLFNGPASDRRKFLDRLCLVQTPAHGRTSLAYEKSRSERSRLFAQGVMDPYWFDALEADMATRGALIAQSRAQCLDHLRYEIDQAPMAIADQNGQNTPHFPYADLRLDGEAENLFEAGGNLDDITDFIKTALRQDRDIDRRAGRSLRGVHRSDLIVSHRAKAMPASLCSTGEQKALLIALILAHARAQADRYPILLLDEVVAHLDDTRRAALIEQLLAMKTQVFMTGTDAHLFAAFEGRAQMFLVENGALQPMEHGEAISREISTSQSSRK